MVAIIGFYLVQEPVVFSSMDQIPFGPPDRILDFMCPEDRCECANDDEDDDDEDDEFEDDDDYEEYNDE